MDSISCRFSCLLPIIFRTVSPGWLTGVWPSHFIPYIHTYHSFVILEHPCKSFQTAEVVFLWVLAVEPQPVSIERSAAPLRFASVVIQNYHQPRISQFSDSVLKYLDTGHPKELWIGLDEIIRDDIIFLEQFNRKCQSDTVHAEVVPDISA